MTGGRASSKGATGPVQWQALCLMVIGPRQLGLFILMHDAWHGLLHPNRQVNDTLCNWLCSSTPRDYRPYHLQHRRYAQNPDAPDLVLSAPFPKG